VEAAVGCLCLTDEEEEEAAMVGMIEPGGLID